MKLVLRLQRLTLKPSYFASNELHAINYCDRNVMWAPYPHVFKALIYSFVARRWRAYKIRLDFLRKLNATMKLQFRVRGFLAKLLLRRKRKDFYEKRTERRKNREVQFAGCARRKQSRRHAVLQVLIPVYVLARVYNVSCNHCS